MRENKFIFFIYQLYKIFIFFPLLGLSTAVFGTLAVVFALLAGPRAGSFMGVLWARFNSCITPMFVKVTGAEHIDKKQSYVVVANHQSQFDIFVIYGWLPMDFKWVMKLELRQVPFLGYSCFKLGHIFIDRSKNKAAVESINAARKQITGGTSIMFFPEGTCSDDGQLMPFKKGAFKFATDMQLSVLPVSIADTRFILPKKSTALFPGCAKLIIHEPIDIKGYDDKNLEALMAVTKKAVHEGLHQSPEAPSGGPR